MKKFVTLVVALFGFSYAVCAKEPQFAANKKVYVHPSQLYILENGIFVSMQNEWVPAESVHMDANGVYVMVDNASNGAWYCRYCNTANPAWRTECKNQACKKPRE
jgi:hypothetical protein